MLVPGTCSILTAHLQESRSGRMGCQIGRRSGHLRGMTAERAYLGNARPGLGSQRPDATFVRLYEEYYGYVFAYCLRRTSRANAEDAAADVFTIAWRKQSDIPQGDKALSWLYGVAYRVMSHQWRSSRRFRNLVSRVGSLRQGAAPSPEEQVVRRAEDRRVLEAAARLNGADQEILRLAGWEELPHEEIAGVLDISVAAVSQRFSRAKKRLAKEYNRTSVRPPDVEKGDEL